MSFKVRIFPIGSSHKLAMKVQEHATAGQEHISVLEMVFLMLVVHLDSLKRNVSVGNWFEIHETE